MTTTEQMIAEIRELRSSITKGDWIAGHSISGR